MDQITVVLVVGIHCKEEITVVLVEGIHCKNRDNCRTGGGYTSKLKIIGVEPMIYRRSWPIEAMMGVR